jgi:hypothetical protein
LGVDSRVLNRDDNPTGFTLNSAGLFPVFTTAKRKCGNTVAAAPSPAKIIPNAIIANTQRGSREISAKGSGSVAG